MTSPWQPHSEPLRATLLRTGGIALAVGAALALRMGDLRRWPLASLLVLWFSLGGHFVELWFLNWLRPRISAARATQVGSRLAVWFAGGVGLGLGMTLTARLLAGPGSVRWQWWWLGGVAFIGVELVVHLVLRLLGRPNFWDGRA